MEQNPSQKLTQEISKKPITYTVKGKIFIVEPIFQIDGKETLGDVLIRLMKSDITES